MGLTVIMSTLLSDTNGGSFNLTAKNNQCNTSNNILLVSLLVKDIDRTLTKINRDQFSLFALYGVMYRLNTENVKCIFHM